MAERTGIVGFSLVYLGMDMLGASAFETSTASYKSSRIEAGGGSDTVVTRRRRTWFTIWHLSPSHRAPKESLAA